MTEPVTLEVIARQLERALTQIGTIEDQLASLTELAIRHEGAVTELAIEVRTALAALA